MTTAVVVVFILSVVVSSNSQWVHEETQQGTKEGDDCHWEGGRRWFCSKISDCPNAKDLIQSGTPLRTCSWEDANTHIICCPPEKVSEKYKKDNSRSISEQKCAEFAKRLCIDGVYRGSPELNLPLPAPTREPMGEGTFVLQAVGGEDALPKEHPHMALIGYGSADDINWQCGGSLISEWFVLSAAHCSDTGYGPAKWARLGDLDVSVDSDDANPQQFEIVERLVHSGYQPPAYYNDIALFRLDRAAVFDRYVGPACLHTSMADPAGFGVATGWGKNETNGPRSSALVKVDLKFIPTEVCKTKLGTLRQYLPEGMNTTTMICAGEPGKDTCQGDSGGPLVLSERVDRGCIVRQVGVTSFGPKFCGMTELTGTYVRVAHFVPWIESIVWPT